MIHALLDSVGDKACNFRPEAHVCIHMYHMYHRFSIHGLHLSKYERERRYECIIRRCIAPKLLDLVGDKPCNCRPEWKKIISGRRNNFETREKEF